MIEPQYLNTLREICIRLSDCQSDWVITGSLGMALQGMDIEIHDIDIQPDRHGAYEIANIFSEYVVKAVHYSASERIRSYLGSLEVDGVKSSQQSSVKDIMTFKRRDFHLALTIFAFIVGYFSVV